MSTKHCPWDPFTGTSWAKVLGMVRVPLFGKENDPKNVRESAILLDGSKASFAFLCTENRELAEEVQPLSWSWSSHVRHIVAVVPANDSFYLRCWDRPEVTRRFRLPKQAVGAVSLLQELEAASEPRRPDVIRYILEPFRQIRQRVNSKGALWAIRLLNSLLLSAETLRGRPAERWPKTFAEVVEALPSKDRRLCGVCDLPEGLAEQHAHDLIHRFVQPEPYTGCEIIPSLLFRHAASKLYQEAHLEIERNPQGYLPGLEPVKEPSSSRSPRDVRFTPPNLARALIQRSLDCLPSIPKVLTVLDPACGSGVFLTELLHELQSRGLLQDHSVRVIGYDISEISQYTARFCLEYTRRDLRLSRGPAPEVVRCDSLETEWAEADIILMNPPFISWERLDSEQRQKATSVLGPLAEKRPDFAMAFLMKAVQSLRAGGVLASVLPAPVLSSRSAFGLRERLGASGSLDLIGRFEGYRFFPTSLVETAFLVYQKERDVRRRSQTVEVLISGEGAEDAALRALRLAPTEAETIEGVDRFSRSARAFPSETWRPLRRRDYEKRDHLASLELPRASDLFDIRQGARLGHRVFLLRDQQFRELGRKEKGYFRPAAGGGSIRDGQLTRSHYVFYPYTTDGSSLIQDEAELRSRLPAYYERHLRPAKPKLAARRGFADKWWELDRKRSWQTAPSPNLISTYFGGSGSFAFDDAGEYVTVNGHAWLWANDTVAVSEDERLPFEQTPGIWAYLAFVNSTCFEEILALFSVPLQGGQIRLEQRFLANVPLPDFCGGSQVSSGHFERLVHLGKAIHAGGLRDILRDLDGIVRLIYGLK